MVIALYSFIIIFFLPSVVSAKEPSEYISEYSAIIPQGLPSGLSDGSVSDAVSISSLLNFILLELSGKKSEIAAFYILLCGITLVSLLCSFVFENMKQSVRRGIGIASSFAVFSALAPLLSSVRSSLSEANTFFLSSAPVMCALNLAGGGTGSAAIGATGMSLTAAFIATVSTKILPYVSTVGLASALLGGFGGNLNIAKSAKNLYMRLFGALSLLISVTLSLQTVVAAAQDSAAMRAAKYGASTLIPSVGGVVSSAMSTLVGGLSYAKSVIGASAIGVMLYVFISPLLLLLIYRVGISVALSVTELVGEGDIASLSAFLSVLDSFIASYVIACLMYVLEFVLFLKGGALV